MENAPKTPESNSENLKEAAEVQETEKAIEETEAQAIGKAANQAAEMTTAQQEIIHDYLPDGSPFSGTREEYNQAIRDYLDNVGH